jgi:peroxisomal enoyl-CoA hydratase 2
MTTQVHGSMSVENLKTLPPSSGEGWKIKKRVVGVHENSTSPLSILLSFPPPSHDSLNLESGIILDIELLLVDAKEVPYTKMIVRSTSSISSSPLILSLHQTSSFNVGAKATGQKFSKSIAATPAPSFAVPPKDGKKADHVVTEKVSEEQAILYRLSGDYNPLHIGSTSPPFA